MKKVNNFQKDKLINQCLERILLARGTLKNEEFKDFVKSELMIAYRAGVINGLAHSLKMIVKGV